MRYLRSTFRFLVFATWSLVVIITIGLIQIFAAITGNSEKVKRQVAHKLFNIFLRVTHKILGMRITWHGEKPTTPHVVMANHRSYADAVVLPVSFPVVFVARHETKSWPIIGWGANLLGTIWVKRKIKESRRATRAAVKDRLENGYGIAIFPEGTTAVGPELLEYHKGMFYTCAENDFPIAAAAIEFEDQNIAWVGNTWFIPHAFKHFGARKINIHVSYGPSFRNSDAEQLLTDVRNWTQAECLRLRSIIEEQNS